MSAPKRARTTDDKEIIDKSDANKMATLYKHMNDWFSDHPGEAFISPRDFQNAYPQWDKYSSESFRKVFYSIKGRISKGKFYLSSISSSSLINYCDSDQLYTTQRTES